MESNTTLINSILNNLQQHVSALKTHLQVEYKGVGSINNIIHNTKFNVLQVLSQLTLYFNNILLII